MAAIFPSKAFYGGDSGTASGSGHTADARSLIRELMRAVCDTPIYKKSRKKNAVAGAALLDKMRKGVQELGDFDDEHALWGYVNAIAARRSFNVCESFAGLVRHDESGRFEAALRGRRDKRCPLRVASLGGGPACCLMGFAVFERLALRPAEADIAATSEEPTTRFHLFDFAAAWAPICARVSAALGEPIAFGHCDLARGLDEDGNGELRKCVGAELDVLLFVYALHESDHTRVAEPQWARAQAVPPEPRWARLLLACWDGARQGTVFVVKDQRWLEEAVLKLIGARRPGTFHACAVPRADGARALAHDSDGLFLLKADASPDAPENGAANRKRPRSAAAV